MASGSNNLTTYYAKRIIGDTAAANADKALLQTGDDIGVDTWILNRTNRASLYGIKYEYDDSTNGTADKIELYGGYQVSSTDTPTAWVRLDTGDVHILGHETASYYIAYTMPGFILSVSGSPWPYIRFDTRAGGTTYETTDQNNWCALFAQVPAKSGSTYYSSRFFFREYSKTANTTTSTGYYEDYYLPTATDGLTANVSYDILTTKNTVTTAQGGTGNTSYTASRLLYTESATKLSSSNIVSDGNYIAKMTYLTVNTDHQTSYRFYVDGNSFFNGAVTLKANQYYASSVGLNMNNSDLFGVNSIRFADTADAFNEGIMFYRNGSAWECMAANSNGFFFRTGTDGSPALTAANANAALFADTVWGNKVRIASNYISFYATAGDATTRYGFIQCNADRMYFRKENGVSSYHFDFAGHIYTNSNLYISGANNGIYFQGTKQTYRMIRFIDNTADTSGNGISIGGGGLSIFGSGESADTMVSNLGYTGGSEVTVIASDGSILFYPGNNSYDASAKLEMTASRFWAGVNGNTTREAQVGCQSGAGQIYFWSAAATSGNRGVYVPAHGTGSAIAPVESNTNNSITLRGHDTWGGKVRMTSNWVGFYASDINTTTRYGYIQCNVDRMYFRKENSTASLSYYYDFNASMNISGTLYTTGAVSATSYVYTASYLQAKAHIYVDTGHLKMKYGSTWYDIVANYNNGNVTMNACGGGVFLGYTTTTSINFLNGKATLNSSGTLTATTFQGNLTGPSGNNLVLKAGFNNVTLTVQGDGNLVLNKSGTNVWYTNTGSSRLMKENIRPITNLEISNFDRLNVISFNYKPQLHMDTNKHYGLIAEEVINLYPNLVDIPDNYNPAKFNVSQGLNQPYISLNYEGFIPLLIKMVQIQRQEINDLKKQLTQILDKI